MTVRVDVVIMAHRRRAAFIPELQAKLDRPARVVFDRRNDRWDTGGRSWQAIDRSASHGLVVQDDAIVPRDLVAGVETALRHVPDGSPVSLYCGRTRPYRDVVQELVGQTNGATSWLAMSQCHWGVGIVLPTALIDDMIAWCDPRTDVANYDRRISRWCQSRGLTVYYPWPSLVDHRDSPSLVPNRGSAGRRAHRFVGANRSALDQRYDGATVAIPALGGGKRLYQHLGRTKGGKVKFVNDKHPQLQVYRQREDGTVARLRFRDGRAQTSDPLLIAYLLTLGHLGVATAGEPETATEPAGNGTEPAAEPKAEAEVTAGRDDQGADTDQDTDVAEGDGSEPPVGQPNGVPAAGAKEILAWVGEDPQRARQALDAEQQRDKPRTTLAAALTKLAG